MISWRCWWWGLFKLHQSIDWWWQKNTKEHKVDVRRHYVVLCCWGRRRQGRLWQVRAIASSFHGKWFLHACRSRGWADVQCTSSMDQPTFVKPHKQIDGLTDWPSDLLNPNSNPFHKWHIFRQRMTTSKLAMKERHLVLLHGGDCIRPASGSKPNEPTMLSNLTQDLPQHVFGHDHLLDPCWGAEPSPVYMHWISFDWICTSMQNAPLCIHCSCPCRSQAEQ